MTLRPATLEDIHAIVGLLHEGDEFHRPFERYAIRQEDAPPVDVALFREAIEAPDALVLVGEQDGIVVGFVRVSLSDRPKTRLRRALRAAHIEEIVVAARARRSGLGTRLMTEAWDWTQQNGAERVTLGVFEENTAAVRFYASLGYRLAMHTMAKEPF